MGLSGRDSIGTGLLAAQETGRFEMRKHNGPVVEVSEDVACLLAAFAKDRGQPLDQAANEVLARFLYQGATID